MTRAPAPSRRTVARLHLATELRCPLRDVSIAKGLGSRPTRSKTRGASPDRAPATVTTRARVGRIACPYIFADRPVCPYPETGVVRCNATNWRSRRIRKWPTLRRDPPFLHGSGIGIRASSNRSKRYVLDAPSLARRRSSAVVGGCMPDGQTDVVGRGSWVVGRGSCDVRRATCDERPACAFWRGSKTTRRR